MVAQTLKIRIRVFQNREFNFYQRRFVVVGKDRAAEEFTDVVVTRENLCVLGRETSTEEGEKGGGGDVHGGEAEDVYDFSARIELGVLCCPLDTRDSLYTWLSQASCTRSKELLYLSTSRTNSSSCSLMNL